MLSIHIAIQTSKHLNQNKNSLQWYVLNRRNFPAFTECVVLWNCFLNDLGVKSTSLFNFYKKEIVWKLGVRSHLTQDLGDTRLFSDIRFADLISCSRFIACSVIIAASNFTHYSALSGKLSNPCFLTGYRILIGQRTFFTLGSSLEIPQDHVTAYVIIYGHQILKFNNFEIYKYQWIVHSSVIIFYKRTLPQLLTFLRITWIKTLSISGANIKKRKI